MPYRYRTNIFSINKKGELYKTCDICRNIRLRSPGDDIIISDAIKILVKATQTLELVVKDDTIHSDTDSESIKNTDKTQELPLMVFDVEHTGCTDAFILQLSWGLYKRDGTLIEMKDYFLRPDHEIFIHPRAIEIYKIPYEALLQKPNTLDFSELSEKIMKDASRCDILVAHNINPI